LDTCLWHLGIGSFSPFSNNRQKSKYEVVRSLECITELTEYGALWRPNDRSQMSAIRRALYGCEPSVTVELLKPLVHNNACPRETILDLLRTPRMIQHISPCVRQLSRLGLKMSTRTSTRLKAAPQAPISPVLLSHYNRDELYQKVWSEPMRKLAKQYEMSDVGLAKICRKLSIPLPGRGYWAKKTAGKRVKAIPPLPSIQSGG
jgi:hypothetical protein